MRFYKAIVLATLASAAATLVSAAGTKSRKESVVWKPCLHYSDPSGSSSGSLSGEGTECAVYEAPLCHPGVCETPKGIDSTIEVFVKRMPATRKPETTRNVWLLQEGPGRSSTLLESTMEILYGQLDGVVNIYLMDHRGTGRSTRLDCSAEKATNTSIWGREVKPLAVGACAEELASKYGDLASFSMTSAAMDLAYFIDKHTNGEDTIVYGLEYGTALAERLMHLNPPSVTGYVLDGVATTGSSADESPYYSNRDTDFGEVVDKFLAQSEEVEEISARFKKRGLTGAIKHLIAKLDQDPDSVCAGLINELQSGTGGSGIEPPSFALRRMLGTLLPSTGSQTFIPPIVYRLNRCASKDVDVLRPLIKVLNDNLNTKAESDNFQSPLLNNLITFSELWEKPTPSVSALKKRFKDVLMSDKGVYSKTKLYCAFSKEQSKTCNKFKVGNYDADPIVYERDEYWGKRAVIPIQASVLLLSSKIDTQTPHKYAEYLLHALKGSNKELITFDYAMHDIVLSTTQEGATCGMEILASFVKSGGDLETLDKSCVDKLPGFNMTINLNDLMYTLYTTDAYDGAYDASILAGEQSFWGEQ